jgi:hypothetical protein
MAYKTLVLDLTEEQQRAIEAEVESAPRFGLIAQPYIRGFHAGELQVYFCTPEQYAILDAAVREARELPMFE